jgi:dihydrofolate reductase
MRKVIESTLVSIDGVIGDPPVWAGEYFGEEAERAALEQLLASDAMLMGRRTYEMFAAMSLTGTGDYADRMNSIRKYVFSSTLEKADWNNTTIISGDAAAAVAELKQQGGQPLIMYGHGPLGADVAGAPVARRAPVHDPPCRRRPGNPALPGG